LKVELKKIPLPTGEGWVRGTAKTLQRYPSPGAHLSMDAFLSRRERDFSEPGMLSPVQKNAIPRDAKITAAHKASDRADCHLRRPRRAAAIAFRAMSVNRAILILKDVLS